MRGQLSSLPRSTTMKIGRPCFSKPELQLWKLLSGGRAKLSGTRKGRLPPPALPTSLAILCFYSSVPGFELTQDPKLRESAIQGRRSPTRYVQPGQ